VPELGFNPNWAAAPADSIRRVLIRKGWSSLELADAMRVPVEIAQSLIDGTRDIDGIYAERLGQALDTSPTFWIKRQSQYASATKHMQDADGERAWLRELPLKDMIRLGWIAASKNDAQTLSSVLAFFGVSDVAEWRTKFRPYLAAAAFRTSLTFTSNPVATTAWLRWAELQAGALDCKPWDAESFRTTLTKIRALTRRKRPSVFIPELQRLCAECGVAVIVAKAPEGCRASGATRFVRPDKAMIVMSFRYRSDDHFWFTFFHEAGHLILHGSDALFLEDGSDATSDDEDEANAFASNLLIPPHSTEEFGRLGVSARDVMRFAVRIGVSPGIVVGQLQNCGRIPRNRLNRLKRRYVWTKSPAKHVILEMR
jgi:HTH-type transcriptional regulator/antitoxin HigA